MKSAVLALLFGAVWSLAVAQPVRRPPVEPVKLKPGETAVSGECLTKEELELIAELDGLKRPTVNEDAQKPFNPHYLVGVWKVEGTVPESPLGAAGTITAVETVRRVDACTYESTIQAKGPDRAFTVKSTMVYDPKAKYMVRLEHDSRGFQLLKAGRVGGDSGGYFTHYWEVPPFIHKGKKVRLKGSAFFASPVNYRLRMQIAVDDQAFENYGTIWWRRDGATP
jgi:hypothetical protein